MVAKTPLERVACSPGEFATLFGKSQTWGYRQIYAGKVKTITDHGRILIPAAEVDAILKAAGVYNGIKPKPARTKAESQKLTPKLGDAWSVFLVARRNADAAGKSSPQTAARKTNWPLAASGRQAALARLVGKRGR